jgi:hypothetical protein
MADNLPDKFEAEILKVGTWNSANAGPVKITKEILSEIVNNFEWFNKLRRVPIKLGHHSLINRKELSGGQPIFGEVENLRLSGDVLIAKFKDVHKTVMEAIRQKLFKDVSAEVHRNVTRNGKSMGRALTGVAVLGIESPAVKGLKDLQALLSDDSETIDISDGVVVFEEMTVIIEDKGGEEDMGEDTKHFEDEIKRLKGELSDTESKLKKSNDEKVELSESLDKIETEKTEAERTASIDDVKEFCEGKVKDMKMSPAARDAIVSHLDKAEFSESNEPIISVTMFKECMDKMHEMDTEEKGSKTEKEEFTDLNAEIDAAKKQYKKDNPDITDETVIFSEVMNADKDLAARYMKETI